MCIPEIVWGILVLERVNLRTWDINLLEGRIREKQLQGFQVDQAGQPADPDPWRAAPRGQWRGRRCGMMVKHKNAAQLQQDESDQSAAKEQALYYRHVGISQNSVSAPEKIRVKNISSQIIRLRPFRICPSSSSALSERRKSADSLPSTFQTKIDDFFNNFLFFSSLFSVWLFVLRPNYLSSLGKKFTRFND